MERNLKKKIQLQVNLNLKIERGRKEGYKRGKQAQKEENIMLVEKVGGKKGRYR